MQGLQVLSHLAQGVLDLTGLIQNLHAGGKRVVAHRKRTFDGCRVSPMGVNESRSVSERQTQIFRWMTNKKKVSGHRLHLLYFLTH